MNARNLDRRASALEGPAEATPSIKVVMTNQGMTEEEISALEAAARQEVGPHGRIITLRFVAPGDKDFAVCRRAPE